MTVPAVTVPEVTSPELTAPGVTPIGFDTVAVRVTPASPDGEVCEFCAWLANTDDRRRRGLMGVTDLGDPRAMAFVYSQPRTTNFTMRNTLLPLSIAFFDESGAHLGEFDMVPCTGEPCPAHPTPVGFWIALEAPTGELVDLGIGPGARLELLAGDAAAGLC